MFEYPQTRRDEEYSYKLDHEQGEIKDPYHWLQVPHSQETKAFVDAQNTLFSSHIQQWSHKQAFKDKLTKMTDYEKFGCPFRKGDSYYYFHNSGLQPQSTLYKQTSLTADPTSFLDPNKLSADGTVSLNTYSFTQSGKQFAYGLSASGSDWITITVKSTEDESTDPTKEPDVKWAKFTGIAWTHDEKGFFYNRYPRPSEDVKDAGTETDKNLNAFLCYHRVGTPQEEDVVCFKDADHPTRMFGAEVSDDGKYVIVTVSESCDPKNLVYIAELSDSLGLDGVPVWKGIVTDFQAAYSYISNEGTTFYFTTTLNAPKKRIVKVDITTKQGEEGFVEVIPERHEVLEYDVLVDKNKLVLIYLQDVKHVMYLHDLVTGKPLDPPTLPLPMGSIINGLSGRKKDTEIFYKFSSFLTPGSINRFDFTTMECTTFRETVVAGHNPDDFETKQVFYPSKDGTKIPMFIVSKKGVKLDGDNVILLYGYGGFNASITPAFSVNWLSFIKHLNGVVAVANIRGGGEYGEELWYAQGKLTKKQNVFDDFQYAAKYLVSSGYTKPARLAINGGSNGGLLVGACINQAPELFGCAIADVGVMDMYTFHKWTIGKQKCGGEWIGGTAVDLDFQLLHSGHAWVSDYGNPDKLEDFLVLQKYSPVHNVDETKEYPPTLLTTSDHDDRVVPLHSYKFIATLQHKRRNNKHPLLMRVDTKAGHGAGKSTQQRIEEASDKYAFLALSLNAKWTE